MEKKYEVFISSTFIDLKDERESVMRAVLELGCFPAGMELFPAGEASQWEVIRTWIDRCDYYVVLVAGRYGSVDEDNLSYTEKEFDYAVHRHIPVLAFVHGDPDSIPVGKTDKSDEAWKRVEAFRKKVSSGRTRVEWRNPDDLAKKVMQALINAFENHPRPGWVRGGLPGESKETAEDGPGSVPPPSKSMVRRYLQNNDYRFQELLSDTLSEAREVAETIRADRDLPQGEYTNLVKRCEEASAGLAEIAADTAYFGNAQHHEDLITAVNELLKVNAPRGGLVHLNQLRVYPAVVAFYSAGVASVARPTYALLRRLHAMPVQEPAIGSVHALYVLSPRYVFGDKLPGVLPDGRRLRTPDSDRLFGVVKGPLCRLPFMTDKRYEEMFARFEYLNALVAQMSERGFPFIGRFLWYGVQFGGRGGIAATVSDEVTAQGEEWLPFKAGLLGSDFSKVKQAQADLQQGIRQYWLTNS